MGDRLLSEYRSDLLGATARPNTAVALVDRWVNDAVKEVGYAFKFPELEAKKTFLTVAGTYEYPLAPIAADYRMLHEDGVWIQAPYDRIGKLKKENHSRWLRNAGDLTDTTVYNRPAYYHRYGKSLLFRPIPDATVCTILVHYWKKISLMVNPGDTTFLDADWDEIIYLGALYRAMRHAREFDRYLNIRNDFLGLVRSRAMEEDVEEIAQGGLNIVTTEDGLVAPDG